MKLHKIDKSIVLPISLNEAWNFFSCPSNLKEITPKELNFKILENDGENCTPKMYPGLLIQYTVSPILGIPMNWVTEITQVKKEAFFVDEQRFGPYKMWHHKHFFKAVEGGTEIRDLVHYVMPFSIFGTIAHGLFVKNQVEDIFEYREKVLREKFT